MNCEHRRIKKNFPFGKNSSPDSFCKDCGHVVKPKDFERWRIEKERNRRKRK